jgi:carboxylesterase
MSGAVVLLHEIAGTPASVEPVAERLRARGLVVVTPLLPGHGTHWTDLGTVTWKDWLRAGARAIAEAEERSGGGPVVISGVSVGGALALRLAAAEAGRVAAVVPINAALANRNPLLPLVPVLRFVIRSLPNGPEPEPGADPARTPYPRLATRAIGQLPPLWRDVRRHLPDLRCPVLVLRSASEGAEGVRSSAIVRAGARHTQVTEVVLENSGHLATTGADSPWIADLIASRTAPHDSVSDDGR